MSRSELHDWEWAIRLLCVDNADKVLAIAQDIYNTAFVRGKNYISLEQQPSEDCISRKAVSNIITKWLSHPDYELKDNIYDMTRKISKLPPVTPQTVTEFADKCKEFGKIQNELFEDAVSREAVEKLKKYRLSYDTNTTVPKTDIFVKIADIKELPSVTPRRDLAETSQDCISRQAVLEYIDKMPSELTADGRRVIRRRRLEEYISDTLPPVILQRPKGKWIEHEIRDTCRWLTCSVCEYEWINKKENFCPNCGAEMSGGGEE